MLKTFFVSKGSSEDMGIGEGGKAIPYRVTPSANRLLQHVFQSFLNGISGIQRSPNVGNRVIPIYGMGRALTQR